MFLEEKKTSVEIKNLENEQIKPLISNDPELQSSEHEDYTASHNSEGIHHHSI